MSESQVRQNFHANCEAAINKLINLELYASYIYLSMAYHFDREDVALVGFHNFFKKQSCERRCHAEKLMEYQNLRGGQICLMDINKPDSDDWGSGLEAMKSALKLEKRINQSMLEIHNTASVNGDPQMSDFIEDDFMNKQVESIKKMSGYITNLTAVGSGLGEFMFDKETFQEEQES